jgi:GxxExxY protein
MTEMKKHSGGTPELNALTGEIVDSIFQVHSHLGPGYFERIYEEALCEEFFMREISFEKQKDIAVAYKDKKLPSHYRLDLIVEGQVIIELKSIERLLPVHEAQVIAYLKMTQMPIGFLVNFNVPLIRDGIKRLVLTEKLRHSVSPC